MTTPYLHLISFSLGLFIYWVYFQFKKGGLNSLGDEIIHRAEMEAEEKLSKLELSLKEKALNAKQLLDETEKASLKKIEHSKQALEKREERIEQRELQLEKDKKRLSTSLETLEIKQRELQEELQAFKEKQQQIVGQDLKEAKQKIFAQLTAEIEREEQQALESKLYALHNHSQKEVQKLVIEQLCRLDLSPCVDLCTSLVPLPNNEAKRRLIGKEGKNIRHLERLTGVNFLLDETPHAVVISSFDPIRREIARKSVETLIRDGRIHPSRIEEVVEKMRLQWEADLPLKGKEAAHLCGVADLHPQLLLHIGKLFYLTTAGQNVWSHSIEVARIMGNIASELNLDSALARRIGLLHDIGKSLNSDVEGSHALNGEKLVRRYEESEQVANGIAAHHDEKTPHTLEAALCPLANTLSSSRLGARVEAADSYLQRLKKYETYACELKGVEQAFVLQSGKEIRVVVSPEDINEYEAHKLALKLAKKIEEEMSYRGKIKVVVVRETKAVEFAQ